MGIIHLDNMIVEAWEDPEREQLSIKIRFPHNFAGWTGGKSGFMLKFTREMLRAASYDVAEGENWPSRKVEKMDHMEQWTQKKVWGFA